jgi:hypothetical protein
MVTVSETAYLIFLLKAVERAFQDKSNIKDKSSVYEAYLSAVDGKSNNQAREIAADMIGEPVFWDCDRTWSNICCHQQLSFVC